MVFQVSDIAVKVTADTGSGEAGLLRVRQEMDRAAKAANDGRAAFLNFGKQGQVTGQQMQALGYQFTDIWTSLASGQRPLMVLLQQGGQLRDQFGGVGNVFRALQQVLSPTSIALGALAATVGAAGYAFYAGAEQSSEFRKSLALTGNAAGITAGQVDELAGQLSELSGNTVGNARDALYALAKSGQFTTESIGSVGRAALIMQRLTGESIDDVVKRFAAARDGVTRWATENTRSYNYLTAAQREQIRTLEAQGKTQEALRVNFEALAQTLEKRGVQAIGTMESAWQAVKRAASGAWDAMTGGGRDKTLEQQLADLQFQMRTGGDIRNTIKPPEGGTAAQKYQERTLKDQIVLQRLFAEEQAKAAAEANKGIQEASKAHQDAINAIARAGTQLWLAQQQAGYDAAQTAAEGAYQRFEITAIQARDRLIRAERGRLAAEEAGLRSQTEVERRRVVEPGSQDEQGKQAALLGLEQRRVELLAKRAKIEEEIRQRRRAVPGERGEDYGSAQARFRRGELDEQRAGGAAELERRLNGDAGIKAFLEQNRALSVDLIQDSERRGLKLIELDANTQRRRLLEVATTADQVRQIEDATSEYIRLRNEQLTEQLKPEWQRRIELYGDSARAQKENTDNLMNATTQSAEEAFIAMTTQGRDFAKTMRSTIEQEVARIGWRKYLAEPFSKVLDLVIKALGGFLGGLGGGGGNVGGGEQVAGGGFVAYHGGGIAGNRGAMRSVSPLVFAGARRYHGGGLASNEIPAILQRGEEVLTRRDPRHVLNAGGQPTIVQNNVYNVPDGTSPAAFAAALTQHREMVKVEMFNELSRPGRPLYAAARG